MRKFDENLALKCSKTVIDKIYEYMADTFTISSDYNIFVIKVE